MIMVTKTIIVFDTTVQFIFQLTLVFLLRTRKQYKEGQLSLEHLTGEFYQELIISFCLYVAAGIIVMLHYSFLVNR